VEVQRHIGEFRALGADVVAIGQGTGEQAARFCRMLKTSYPCLGDPGKDAYRGFDLARDGWWNVTAKPFIEDPKLAFSRIASASLRGSLMRHSDVLQLGGVVILDRDGVVSYLHRATRSDDLPSAAELLAHLSR
jgi:peroxiredoxin